MKKHGFLKHALLLIILALIAAGCSRSPADIQNPDPVRQGDDNPFKANEEETGILDTMGHGFAKPEMDEAGEKRLPLRYTGGELEIDYYVNASGKAKNVGFHVFVDGKPQPYKFNETAAPYEYMHIFDVKEDDKDTPFKFIFTPVTGKKGDTLDITITSLYNPSFMPDMKDTSSYGGYHSTLQAAGSLYFEKDAEALETPDISGRGYLSNISLSTEPITDKLLERHSGMQKTDMETLERQVLSELYFDGQITAKMDHFQIREDGSLHVSFKLFGHPGIKYQNIFYINHQALTTKAGDVSFETVLAKGEVAVVDVELDLKELDDLNTFYVVSVPMNAEDYPDDVIVLEKTRSILLYK